MRHGITTGTMMTVFALPEMTDVPDDRAFTGPSSRVFLLLVLILMLLFGLLPGSSAKAADARIIELPEKISNAVWHQNRSNAASAGDLHIADTALGG